MKIISIIVAVAGVVAAIALHESVLMSIICLVSFIISACIIYTLGEISENVTDTYNLLLDFINKYEGKPIDDETQKPSLPQVKCPKCGTTHDFDYPNCPKCNHKYE